MSTFNEREKSFEQKFKHDQELKFKVIARRNKLLGQWAAKQMGLADAAAEDYAKHVVMADMQRPGDDDVIEKLIHDFKAKGIEMTEHRVRAEMEALAAEARSQVMGK